MEKKVPERGQLKPTQCGFFDSIHTKEMTVFSSNPSLHDVKARKRYYKGLISPFASSFNFTVSYNKNQMFQFLWGESLIFKIFWELP